MKKYKIDEQNTILWEPETCIHSTKCWKELPGVFQPKNRPWIKIEGASTEKIIAQVNACPSKALQLETTINKLLRYLKDRIDQLSMSVTSGGVDNMEKYQYMLGQIRTYQYLSQEISSLLNKKEQYDEQGTVIDINSKPKN